MQNMMCVTVCDLNTDTVTDTDWSQTVYRWVKISSLCRCLLL